MRRIAAVLFLTAAFISTGCGNKYKNDAANALRSSPAALSLVAADYAKKLAKAAAVENAKSAMGVAWLEKFRLEAGEAGLEEEKAAQAQWTCGTFNSTTSGSTTTIYSATFTVG